MYTSISIQNKKNFIKWFLKHFTLKRLEATWLLKDLMKQDHLLNKVSFVNGARFCPRAMIISSECSDEVPFLFYKQHIVTDDIDKLFHDIRLHQDEDIYIQLNFYHANQNPIYAGVLEENPFAPREIKMDQHDQEVATFLLEQLTFDHQLTKLKQEIDQALDDKDEHLFKKLATELNQLKLANHVSK